MKRMAVYLSKETPSAVLYLEPGRYMMDAIYSFYAEADVSDVSASGVIFQIGAPGIESSEPIAAQTPVFPGTTQVTRSGFTDVEFNVPSNGPVHVKVNFDPAFSGEYSAPIVMYMHKVSDWFAVEL